MEDVPQPAPEPYAPGDQVRIYLDPADPDAHTHGTVCEITDVLKDDPRYMNSLGADNHQQYSQAVMSELDDET